jgi:outer membrane protein, heavy metal efflux system
MFLKQVSQVLLIAIATTAMVGCRSGSNASRFRLLDAFHSKRIDKSEGLIASSEIKSSTVEVAPTSFLLASLPEDDSDKSSSPSDLKTEGQQDGKKQQAKSEAKSAEANRQTSTEHIDSIFVESSVKSTSTLDLQTLEAIALANNPSLSEQQAILDSLRGRWVQAGLKPNPSLGFSGQQLFSKGRAEQIGLYAGQRIVRAEKLAADQQIVCRELEVAEQNLAAQRQRVLTDVRQKYYEVLIAQHKRQLTAELVRIAELSLNKTNSLLEAELGTKIDVLRSTVELQESNMQHQTAQSQLTAAWRQLATVSGQPDLPMQVVQGSIEPQADLDGELLMQQLLQESPEIAAVIAQQNRAHAQLHRALVEPLPDIEVQSIVQHDNGINGTDANLQVTLPIPFRNRNQGAIAEARMQLTAAQYAQQKTELGLKERLAGVWQRYESAIQQVRVYSKPDGILSNSRKTLELIRKAYDAGEVGSLDLILAQRVYSQTSLQYLTALSDYWSSKSELEGLLLKGSLQN